MIQKKRSVRTIFCDEIVAEVAFPDRQQGKMAILCMGAPAMPNDTGTLSFLAMKGFVAIKLRYRGTWESKGEFLRLSPHQDVIDVMDDLLKRKKMYDVLQEQWVPVFVKSFYLFGASFGGPAVLLAASHPNVKKVIALAPVTDWRLSGPDESFEQFRGVTEEGFGGAYRTHSQNWKKLKRGHFYNPQSSKEKLASKKILIIHGIRDRVVPIKGTIDLAKSINCTLLLSRTERHLGLRAIQYQRFWRSIDKFAKSN